jgi:hypothetical protein
MVMRASGGGNVIGYNYFDNGFISYNQGWMETGLNASHLTCPHFELFEGNQAFNIDGDDTWGGAVYITYFRNHATGKRRSYRDVNNRRAIGLMYGHYYYSFVGNVLGTADENPAPFTGFAYEDFWPWKDDPIGLWRLGYTATDWNAQPEARVVNTSHRHANFDYATNSVRWASGFDQTLPDSLYLTSKPGFFGNNPWPWVDATGTTKLYTLPARSRFDAGTPIVSRAVLTRPVPGSSLTSSSVLFEWEVASGALQYWLYVGTTSGGSDLYNSSEGLGLSRAVTGLPATGGTLYVRLWTLLSTGWEYNDYSFAAANGRLALLAMPTPASTFTSPAVRFGWTSASGATQYWLYVGSSMGGADYYNSSQGTSLSREVAGLPTNGSTVYVRLWTLLSSGWDFNDYAYTASSGRLALLTTPTPDSAFTSPSVRFSWTSANGATQYWLYVGSSVGGAQYYDASQGSGLSGEVTGLPTSSSPVYVRLWTLLGTGWEYMDYAYAAANGRLALISSPTPDSRLSSSAAFAWTGAGGALEYWLTLGTGGPSAANIYNASQGTSQLRTVPALPSSGTIYVRIWTRLGTGWDYVDYTYTGGP